MTSLPQSRLVVSQRSAAGWENCRSLGFARDDEKEAGRVLWYPLKPKPCLNGAPSDLLLVGSFQRECASWLKEV
jgi:hypothetical protein